MMKTTLKEKMNSCGQDEMVCLSCEQTIKQTNLSRHSKSSKHQNNVQHKVEKMMNK